MGLGSLQDFNLKEARARARAKRQMLADGINPLQAKRDDRTAKALADARSITFEKAARKFFAEYQSKWRSDKHRDQFMSSLVQYAFPLIGQLAVADIDIAQVLRVLEQDKSGQRFWDSRRVTADRVRSRIEQVLGWSTVRGFRTGDNPARWKGFLDKTLAGKKKAKHHPALPYDRIGEFMIDLRKHESIAAKALEFTILCAARSGETLGARWSEFDLEGKVWTVPKGRIKAYEEHRVPLTDPMLKILQALPHDDPLVFGTIIDDDAMGILMKNLGYASTTPNLDSAGNPDGTFELAVVHGCRATFGTWAEDCTGYPDGVREACLAHKYKTETVASYQRGEKLEKRRALMNDWSKFCAMSSAPKSAKVIPIKGRKA